MLNRKNKLGFTIVELVIVIAIIAILAAVLIPLFSNVIRQATISADIVLVKNLNTILAAEGQVEGKNNTMHDALLDAYENGYIVEKLTPTTADAEILWDQTADRFMLVDTLATSDVIIYADAESKMGGESIVEGTPVADRGNIWELWKVYHDADEIPDNQTYSIYWNSTANFTDDLNVGFDAGENTAITALNYVNNGDAKDVVIRTSSLNTELKINAPEGTIKVYGYGKYLNIQECAPTSVHVFGYFPAGEITKGRVINEAGKVEIEGQQKDAGVGLLWINASTETAADGSTKFEDVIVGAANGASLPELARGEVNISKTGTLVVETQVIEGDSTKTENIKEQDYIWLFKAGIDAQMVVTKDIPSDGKIATYNEEEHKSTLKSEYQMLINNWEELSEANYDAAVQLANEYYHSATNGYYASLDNPKATKIGNWYFISFEDIETIDDLYIDEDIARPSKEELVKETIVSGSIIGDGLTPETAFQIYDYDTMQVISKFYNDGYRYYKVCIEKTNNGHIDCSDWVSVNLNGEFDGAGVIFDNVDYTLFNTAYDMPTIKLSNFTVNANISGVSWGAPVLYASALSTYMDNVTVHGYIQATYAASSFTVWGNYIYGTHNWYFNNCYSDATLQSNLCGAFIAHPYNNDNNGTYAGAYVYLNDTLYDGAMISTNTPQYICGNHTSAKQNENGVFMNFTDSTLYSRYTAVCKTKLTENTNGNGYKYQYGSSTGATAFNSMCDYIKSSENEVIYHNLDGIEVGSALSVQKNESTATAQAYFVISPNDVNETGCYTGTFLKDEFKAFTGDTITTENVKYYTVAINADGASETGVSGTVYNIVSDVYGKTFAGANITIVQYDADGKLVQTDCWIIK